MQMAKDKKINFGKRVQELRRAREMTQQGLAEASRLSISIVAQLERGVTNDPRFSTIQALAEALGVSVEELIAPGE